MQYAKVAEFQRRGAVHFHALIRLDGPRNPSGVTEPPGAVTAVVLASLVAEAASAVQLHVPAVDDQVVTAGWCSGGTSTCGSFAPNARMMTRR